MRSLCCEDKFCMKFKGQTSKIHAMPWNSDAGLFPGKYVYLRFAVDKVEMGQDFITVFRFSPVTVITSVLHTCLYLHGAVFRRKTEGGRGTFI